MSNTNKDKDEQYIIVRISEVLSRDLAVPVSILKSADKNAEAEQFILEKYNNCDIILDADDLEDNAEIKTCHTATEEEVHLCGYPIIRGYD